MRAIVTGTDRELSINLFECGQGAVGLSCTRLPVSQRQFLSFTGGDPRCRRVPICPNIGTWIDFTSYRRRGLVGLC